MISSSAPFESDGAVGNLGYVTAPSSSRRSPLRCHVNTENTPRILTLSCAFPNPAQPGLGSFVRSRMQAVASVAEVKVVAPVAHLAYSRIGKTQPGGNDIPYWRSDGRLEVLHPRWFYPPWGMALNAFLLAGQVWLPLVRLQKRFPFQVIDSHFGFPDGIAASVLASVFGVPFVVTLRGNEPMHARSPLVRWLLRRALRNAAQVITVSERLRDFAVQLGVSPSNVRTIPNGIDTDVFHTRDRLESRRKWGISPHEKVILSAGALIERKGHHRIVKALSALKHTGVSARLLIAGAAGPEGQYEGRIHQAVTDAGLQNNVQFVGYITQGEMAELMSAADVLCLASSREGWPNVVHESLGCGTPVVATDIGGVPEMVPGDCYGFVVPAADQKALEIALRQALEKDWDRNAISAWGRSRSWATVAQEMLDIFNNAVH